jgi:conjugative transfer signal peptidase TraF
MAYIAGLRINLTDSIATGIWLTQDRPVVVGEYVMVCPPDNDVVRLGHSRGYIPAGWCPGGYGPLMKRVAGAAGAQVAIHADGMYVDGARLPHSAPLDQDGAGRPIVAWTPSSFQLASDEVLLYGDGTAASFDARYFGPVPRSLVLSVIVPVLVQTRREESMDLKQQAVDGLAWRVRLQQDKMALVEAERAHERR